MKARNNLTGKLKKAVIGGLGALLIVSMQPKVHSGSLMDLFKDNAKTKQRTTSQEVVAVASKPYNIAEEYLKDGQFKDAYVWYNKVTQDFPESEYAKKAQFKKLLINMSYFKKEIFEFTTNFRKSAEYVETALEFSSPSLIETYLDKALTYCKKANEDLDQAIGYTDDVWVDFVGLEKYLTDKLEVPKKLFIEIGAYDEQILLKTAYNSVIEDISKDGEIDKYELTFAVALTLDYNPSMKETVDKMLNEIIDETRADPYNKIRYEAKKYLNSTERNYMFRKEAGEAKKELEKFLSQVRRYRYWPFSY